MPRKAKATSASETKRAVEKRSRSKSKSVSRSRSRSRGRSKSPARQKASPARTASSPARRTRKESPSRKPSASGDATTPTRRSARLVEKEDELPKQFKSTSQVKSKSSSKRGASSPFCSACASICPYFQSPFMLLMIALALYMPLALFEICTKKTCGDLRWPSFPPKFQAFISRDGAMMFTGFFVFQLLVHLLPVGRIVTGPQRPGKRQQCHLQARYHVLFTALAAAGLFYFDKDITAAYKNQRQIMGAGTIFSIIVSVLLYIRSRKTPVSQRGDEGNTGFVFVDIFNGREVYPSFGRIDLKGLFMDVGVMGYVVMILSMLRRDYVATGTSTPALLLVGCTQLYFLVVYLFFQETFMYDTEWLNSGLGFKNVFGSFVLIPFVFTLPTRFVFEQSPAVSNVHLACSFLLFGLSFILSMMAYTQKTAFMKDPRNPAFSGLESAGDRLISGWFSYVRYPHYTGHILLTLGFCLLTGFSSWIPYLPVVLILQYRLQNCYREDAAMREKSASIYDRYVKRVPARLVPYIF